VSVTVTPLELSSRRLLHRTALVGEETVV